MGKKFCTSCGSVLPDDGKFCENCGAPVTRDDAPVTQPPSQVASLPSQTPKEPALPPAASGGRAGPKVPVMVIAIVAVVIVIAAAALVFVLPKISTTPGPVTGPKITPLSTTVPTTQTIVTAATTITPTPTQNPFPNALPLKQKFPFGSGTTTGAGTVYRYWMNDTYQWHNDKDNKYYTEKPPAGFRFLAVFVDVTNTGSKEFWSPTVDSIHLIYDGKEYTLDQDHYLPDKSLNIKATPIEIQEIQYYSKLAGSEYVEDYGYSHGTKYAYVYPGESNAIDGYLIYEVPVSLTPDKTYVKIEFNGQDTGVWKLA